MSEAKNLKAEASIVDAVALRLTDYFGTAGAKAEVFSTSDANLFENIGFAKNHAATLEDKEVVTHTMNVADLEVVLDEDTLSEEQLELLEKGLVTANYKEMKALVAFLKLPTADQKGPTLIEALEAYKEKLEFGSGNAATQNEQ